MPELKHSLSAGDIIAGDYQILGVAGAGGMGVVYRAHDLKLERTVALKFLPAELSDDPASRQRILREARTASGLDHPNIGVIHGIEEIEDGSYCIVMAYYDGETLADRIRKNPLSATEAVDIAIQMAQGLAAAHARKIVHRDIKPGNVMLTASGGVRIVDFGLARATTASTASQTGMTGTVAYMSPEQAMGGSVDQRTDIWALGCVLTEMLIGRSPFERETVPGMIIAILNEAPNGLDSLPPGLQQALYRALAKNPDERYADCAEVLADLESLKRELAESPGQLIQKPTRASAEVRKAREQASVSLWGASRPRKRPRWVVPAAIAGGVVIVAAILLIPYLRARFSGGTNAAVVKHIAVLPFDNIGSNPENQTLIDGLMDSLAGRLSNLDVGNQSLWVVPNSVVRRQKVTDPSDALKELGANLVIKGSVERDGNDIRLTTNLIDTQHLRQVGSVMVEDQAGDLSTLEDKTVARLARLMNISVTAEMLRATGGRVDPAAYEDYLQALGYMQRYDKPGNLDLALTALQRSTQTDQSFALGYAAAGEAYRLKYQVDQNLNWLNEAQANCQKAAELDNSIPAVFVTLGQIHDAQGKHDLAVQEFQHALQLNPNDASALEGMAKSYENAGRIGDAEKTFEKAAALGPSNWSGYNNLAAFYHQQGKYPQAIAAFRQALQITPDNSELYFNLGATYIDQGGAQSLQLAEQALKKSIALNPNYVAYANLGLLYTNEKRYAEAAAATEKALELNDKDYMVWNNLMFAYEGAKEEDKAAAARRRTVQLAEKVVAVKPQDALTQSTLAGLYAQDKDTAKAEQKIATSLALAPNDPNVLANVGEAYEFLGDRAKALQYIGKAIDKGFSVEGVVDDPSLQALVADPRFKAKYK